MLFSDPLRADYNPKPGKKRRRRKVGKKKRMNRRKQRKG